MTGNDSYFLNSKDKKRQPTRKSLREKNMKNGNTNDIDPFEKEKERSNNKRRTISISFLTTKRQN